MAGTFSTFNTLAVPITTVFTGGHATEWTPIQPPRSAKVATFVNKGTGVGRVSIGYDLATAYSAAHGQIELTAGSSITIPLTDGSGARSSTTVPLVSVFGADGATHLWHILWGAET